MRDKAKSEVNSALYRDDPTTKNSIFWMEHSYYADPDNFEFDIALLYINGLKEAEQYDKAIQIVEKFDLDRYCSPSDPDYGHNCILYSLVYLQSKRNLHLALEYALKVPTDSADYNDTRGILFQILQTLHDLTDECEDQNGDTTELCATLVRVSKVVLDRGGHGNWGSLTDLGTAYCTSGDHLEGCRFYRKGLAAAEARGFFPETHAVILRTKIKLIIAQLQYPGMPLENYYIFAPYDNIVQCVKKEDKKRLLIRTSRVGALEDPHHVYSRTYETIDPNDVMRENSSFSSDSDVPPNTIVVKNFPIPSDPDDPTVFPEDFLAQVRP